MLADRTGWLLFKHNHIVWISHTKFFNEYLSMYARFKDFRVLLEVRNHQRSKNIPEKYTYIYQ